MPRHTAQDAPYLLEPFVDGFASEDPSVRLAVLTAAMQLFFRRPPEMKPILGAALSAGVVDNHADVHDRALLYYRCVTGGVSGVVSWGWGCGLAETMWL